MGKIILMPKLDDYSNEAIVSGIICKVGEISNKGDILMEVETEKSSIEIYNEILTGEVLAIYVKEGETVKENDPLIYIG